MIFNSIVFIFFFLPMSLLIFFLTPIKYRKYTLLIASIIFFFWGNVKSLWLLIFSIIVNYLGTMIMDARKEYQDNRKSMLVFLVTFNVLILFVFKYLGFFTVNINSLFGTKFYIDRLIQPLGLSFMTFQILSYNFDVYYRKYPCERNIFNLALYFTMFPQLGSGPIMRFNEIRPQLEPGLIKLEGLHSGAERFMVGLFKKVFIANTLGALWSTVKSIPFHEMSLMTAWVGILAFTLYIYFDFSGYMDMAIGVANLFGIKLKENFNFPYISTSVADFWRRWHISLGSWFRDYVYIPLGGSRTGNLIFNIMAVWLLTGIWHGASWNFIVWGVYFGVVIIIEKYFLGKILKRLPNFISNLYTMLIVMIGWVFFDTKTLGDALTYLGIMVGKSGILFDKAGIYYLYTHGVIFILAFLLVKPNIFKIIGTMKDNLTTGRKFIMTTGLILMFLISIAYILNQSYSPSMYIGF